MKHPRYRTNYRYTEAIVYIFQELSKSYVYVRTHSEMSSYKHDYKLEHCIRYINDVNKILNNLDPVSYTIITCTYGNGDKPDNLWWQSLYSKTTFYRLRNLAIEKFVRGYRACFLSKRSA